MTKEGNTEGKGRSLWGFPPQRWSQKFFFRKPVASTLQAKWVGHLCDHMGRKCGQHMSGCVHEQVFNQLCSMRSLVGNQLLATSHKSILSHRVTSECTLGGLQSLYQYFQSASFQQNSLAPGTVRLGYPANAVFLLCHGITSSYSASFSPEELLVFYSWM
jgi:hypothetical protein